MITIDQLLESVDLDFEPRWVTKDKNGMIWLWEKKPHTVESWWDDTLSLKHTVGCFKLAEFENKPWQECIYEVQQPEKTTHKIARLTGEGLLLSKDENGKATIWTETELFNKINELVDAVNELKENKGV